MTLSTLEASDPSYLRSGNLATGVPGAASASPSAVSWGAILAGAAAAAALSMILLILGTGLGLSSVSPWHGEGLGAKGFGISTILWITFAQLVASGMGGYLAGRLRTKWVSVHGDEVYFRDTAHGFLAWAVASLATAAVLTSAIGSIVSTGVQGGASLAGATAGVGAAAAAKTASDQTNSDGDTSGGPMGYFVDSLFRSIATPDASASTTSTPANASSTASPAPEVGRIFANAARTGTLPQEDLRYVGQLVSQRTGLGQAEAEKRVSDAFIRLQARLQDAEAAARDAADKTRKASAYASLWMFVSLLIGAFVASLAATYGGRRRDGV